MQKIRCVVAKATLATPQSQRNGREPSEEGVGGNEIRGLVIPYPIKSDATVQSTGETSDLLAQLEAENVTLRHRAVELALEIRELDARRLR